MSSLLDKLKAARAMQQGIADSASAAEKELDAKVEASPEIEGELTTGAAQAVSNQESPMAKLRKRMAARQEGLAEPKEATQAAQSLNGTASVSKALEEQTIEYEAQEPEPVERAIEAEQAGQHVEYVGHPEQSQPAERKLTLKEKLALKRAKQAEEQHKRVTTSKIPEHTAPTRTPATHPLRKPAGPAIKAREEIKQAAQEAVGTHEAMPDAEEVFSKEELAEAEEAHTKRQESNPSPAGGTLRSQSKVDAWAERNSVKPVQPEPSTKPTGSALLARIKAKQKAAKPGLDHKPEVSTEAVDKSIADFQNTMLPKQEAKPRVQVEQTGIQGAPQVKAIEADANVAANRQEVKLNAKQREIATLYVDEEKSCVLIGAAGTGKTTGVRGVVRRLIETDKLEYCADYKRFGGSGLKDRVKEQPNVAICAFTRRASINIRDSIISQPGLEEFKYCCQTIHNLLEYAPEYYEAYDDETGEWVEKMRFSPHRGPANPIDCDWLIIEEASMVDLTLWSNLLDALRPGTRILFLGDINQLPPVFGLPVLVYAMHKLTVIELTEVYRTAVGPILRAAHNILKGAMVQEETEDGQAFLCYEEFKNERGKTSLKRHSMDKGSPIMAGETKLSSIYTAMFDKLFETGRYDPEQDMIISPFNVGDLGTLHMNQCLAQFIGDARDAVVHEVLAGFHKHYLAIGDKVMVERQDGVITSINHNTDYMGSLPKQAGSDLSRFGVRILGRNGAEAVDLDEEGDVNFDLDAIAGKTAEELKRAASHVVTVQLESGEEVVLSGSGQFAPEKFTLGYCITGHKSQGSEWRRVFIIMHKRHHSLLTREWLYTTVTRARRECTLLCKPYSIELALANQRISGDTLEDKLAWFTSGAVDNLDEVKVTV